MLAHFRLDRLLPLLMPAKRKTETAHLEGNTAAKRPNTAATRDAARSDPPPPPSSSYPAASTNSLSPSREWAHLPTEMLSLVTSFTSFRALLHLSHVNHRLHELVHEPGSSLTSHRSSSMWRHYPPVTFTVTRYWQSVCKQPRDCVLDVGRDRFVMKSQHTSHISSMLLVLRHVTALRLCFFVYEDSRSAVSKRLTRCP